MSSKYVSYLDSSIYYIRSLTSAVPKAGCHLAVVVLIMTLTPQLLIGASRVHLSAADRQSFQQKILAIPLPGRGCFFARYGDLHWQKAKCGRAPKTPNPMARGPKPFTVGAGLDYFSQPGGLITSAAGSFDSVTNVTNEYGPTANTPNVAHPNVYSLQLNANTFSTSACAGSANCYGWEQFIFSQTQCDGPCIFIEYWLLNHNSSCPAGQGWIYYSGSPTTVPGCFLNTAYKSVPGQPLVNLGGLRLSGGIASNTDTVSLSVENGDVYAASNASIAGLGQGWKQVEYNLVGDCCAFGAYFISGPAAITVKVGTVDGTSNPPICSATPTCTGLFCGDTAETNNLVLTQTCTAIGGAQPSINFTESGSGPLPAGISKGDTHLVTFNGIAYDLQDAGEFILAQAGTDLIVQSRQDFLGSSRAVSWNVAVAVQMGKDLVILYPDGSAVINLKPTLISDGGSVALDEGVIVVRHGNLFTISRPQGDIVQAQTLGDHIDAAVQLGPAEAQQAQGLLVSKNEALVRRGGVVLQNIPSALSLHDYGQSWRVDPAHSLFPAKGRPPISRWIAPTTADVPTKSARDKARGACTRAGVSNAILLKDCALDIAVTGNEALADAYVYGPKPKRDLTPRY